MKIGKKNCCLQKEERQDMFVQQIDRVVIFLTRDEPSLIFSLESYRSKAHSYTARKVVGNALD
jgi:hypothetical protein